MAFSFEVALCCDPVCETLNLYEKMILDYYVEAFGTNRIFNIRRECINSRFGLSTNAETRAKQSAAAIGRKVSDETRARISAAKKGHGPSLEHMERLRTLATGRPMSEQHRQKLAALRTGKKKPAEEIARRQSTRAANLAAKLAAQHG